MRHLIQPEFATVTKPTKFCNHTRFDSVREDCEAKLEVRRVLDADRNEVQIELVMTAISKNGARRSIHKSVTLDHAGIAALLDAINIPCT